MLTALRLIALRSFCLPCPPLDPYRGTEPIRRRGRQPSNHILKRTIVSSIFLPKSQPLCVKSEARLTHVLYSIAKTEKVYWRRFVIERLTAKQKDTVLEGEIRTKHSMY